ncbi:MAG TPA: ThiF family adenylyltransferase [Kiritimatiellia bacterium]|nr:ThiF family adenylyltransferase [Kiritimatiellia bacterium]
MTPTLLIVGCGGSGGWAVQMLSKSPNRDLAVVLMDADRWESRNLDRCLATAADLRKPKVATAYRLLERAGYANLDCRPRYLARGTDDWRELLARPGQLRILSCTDNHAGRRTCLELADGRAAAGLESVVVLTGNETKSASADAYLPAWRGTPLDPRERYPEIKTDRAGDPLHPPCTGEAVAGNPQLALANGLAAFSGLYLMETWAEEAPARAGGEYAKEITDRMPVSVQWTATRQTSVSKGELDGR